MPLSLTAAQAQLAATRRIIHPASKAFRKKSWRWLTRDRRKEEAMSDTMPSPSIDNREVLLQSFKHAIKIADTALACSLIPPYLRVDLTRKRSEGIAQALAVGFTASDLGVK